MDKLQMIQSLKGRLGQKPQSHEDLVQIFEDYKTTLKEIIQSDEVYATGLRRFSEELPDLQRLVDKKHDPILKGRIIDGISALRKKAEEVEAPPVEESAAPDGTPGTNAMDLSVQEEARPRRNMPTLGMD